MKIKLVFCYLLVLPILLAGMQTAQAALVTFDMNYEYSGATQPESPTTPWIRAIFDDGGSAGSVTLRMEAPNLTDAEHVKEWYFNYTGNAILLTIGQPSTGGVGGPPVIGQSNPQEFIAGGGSRYNILFQFAESGADRFTRNEWIEYEITYAGLLAEDFEFLSLGGDEGPFYSAAHVGGIGPIDDDSGWIAPVDDGTTPVPEPATMLLLGSGLLGLAGIGRKRLKA